MTVIHGDAKIVNMNGLSVLSGDIGDTSSFCFKVYLKGKQHEKSTAGRTWRFFLASLTPCNVCLVKIRVSAKVRADLDQLWRMQILAAIRKPALIKN